MTETIRFIDLFGGIGGFRHGLEQASDRFECVDYIEYDKYAVKSYNAIFGEEHEPRDVTELSKSEIADHDLLCAGFPCQSFSVAGNRKGTDEARGKLFREIVRIARAKEPEMLLLENVKGLLSQKAVQDGESIPETKGHAFTEVLQALHELGYCLEWQVLNSKHWGVPQNRERVFIIGHLGGEPQRKVFPIRRENTEDSEEDEREIDAEGLNTTESGESYAIDSNYWKGTNPGDIGSSRTQIVQQNQREEVVSKEESGAVHESMSSRQAPKVINHQMRPESRPSIREEGQSGGSGILYNSDYSYALSGSPHFVKQADSRGKIRVSRDDKKQSEIQGYSTFLPDVDYVDVVDNHDKNLIEPVYSPDFVEKDWNKTDRVGSSDGKMFTVDGTSQHGVAIKGDLISFDEPKRQKGFDSENMFTLRGAVNHGVTDGVSIRKLTPLETWRLQGFPDESFQAAREAGVSDTQLYKQAGNAVTVNVVEKLGEEIQVSFWGN